MNLTPPAFILLWIVPVAWVGIMRSNYPLYPSWIAPLFRVSGIFEAAPSKWRIFFVEIQDKPTGEWHEVDENVLFAATPLGNRTRFQQLMNEIESSAKSADQAAKLLNWIDGHLPQVRKPSSQMKAIRIVHFDISSNVFLAAPSPTQVYEIANATDMPRTINASLNIAP